MLSSIRYRAWPSTSGSTTSRDLSTRPAVRPMISSAGSRLSAQTCSAISSDQPANTDSRRSSTCSGPDSRSWLQSMVARSVRCRGGAVRSPRPSSVKRSASRAAICSADSTVTRAAASSMASGTPSRARQMVATAAALRSVRANPGRAAAARSANSWTAS